ncbi:xanthine dehydrogenase small subunit [Hahella sp. CCB-MM4]|nr:xanthine dehydrogenase small subunit [Hahella sp. CCB-MM4]
MISFCLNGVWKQELDVDPSMTLLRYLRTVQGLTGTKEGCASGDCGACTVLLGYAPDGGDGEWTYESANSCITLLSQLNGKAILTVEALADGSDLHPAQKAMVECHASQCGFCTPGFVMSLAGLHHQTSVEGKKKADRQEIVEALAGNLCRCTGYRPIVDAGEKMLSMPDNHVDIWCPPAKNASAEVNSPSATEGTSFPYVPKTEKELQGLLAQDPNIRLVAGATDLSLEVTQQFKSLGNTAYLGDIASLRTITETDQSYEIGAAVTYTQLEPLLEKHYPEFGGLLKRLGSRQIRNQGTLGGNIGNASPIGDTPPVLLALGAEVQLVNGQGEERWLPLEKFFIGYKQTELQPGEYIRRIRIPKLGEEESLKVYKISKRLEDDISAVLMAVWTKHDQTTIKDIRVAFGGMAAIPARAPNVEVALRGNALSQQTFERAGEQVKNDFAPLTDVRASREYRLQVAANLLQKCGWELMSPGQLNRIENIHGDFSGEGKAHA